jgi:uncharacterized membrane protein YdjX (TVP38/TMEM64 family)
MQRISGAADHSWCHKAVTARRGGVDWYIERKARAPARGPASPIEVRLPPSPKSHSAAEPATPNPGRWAQVRRFGPLLAVGVAMAVIFAMGWHRQLSLENLVQHRAAMREFVSANALAAYLLFIGTYVAIGALSIPGASVLTISGGVLFGWLGGGLAAIAGATMGATVIFLIARSAVGEMLARRAGPLVARFAEGFCADAFSYLLLMRLVPLFPFWLVNLAPALLGVRLTTFVVTTVLGIIPGTFAYAFLGAGIDSVIASQAEAYDLCRAAGRSDCQLGFDVRAAVTPQLLAALAALALVGLIPLIVKRWRARRRG